MISPSFMLCMTQHVGISLMFKRKEFEIIRSRLMEPRHFIQVVLGPRQVGKTTTIRQVLATLGKPSLYFLPTTSVMRVLNGFPDAGRLLESKRAAVLTKK